MILIGNATRNAELRHAQRGKAVSAILLTTSRVANNAEESQHHNIVCWDGLVETVSKHVKTGDPLSVEGRLQHRSFPDEEGTERGVVEIVAADVQFVRRRRAGPDDASSAAPSRLPESPSTAADANAASHDFSFWPLSPDPQWRRQCRRRIDLASGTCMPTTIPATLKATVTAKVTTLLTEVLAPGSIIPRPPGYRWAYPIALYCRWWRASCFLCATYRRPYADGTVEDVEERFARLEYCGHNRFSLAYFRHTGRWITVYPELTLAHCLQAIATEELFQP